MTAILAMREKRRWFLYCDSRCGKGISTYNHGRLSKIERAPIPGLYVATSGTIANKDLLLNPMIYKGVTSITLKSLNEVIYPRLMKRLDFEKGLFLNDDDTLSNPYTTIFVYKTHLYVFRWRQGFIEIPDDLFISGSGQEIMNASLRYDKFMGLNDPHELALRAMELSCKLSGGVGFPFYRVDTKDGTTEIFASDMTSTKVSFEEAAKHGRLGKAR